jgi:hypothetical protein
MGGDYDVPFHLPRQDSALCDYTNFGVEESTFAVIQLDFFATARTNDFLGVEGQDVRVLLQQSPSLVLVETLTGWIHYQRALRDRKGGKTSSLIPTQIDVNCTGFG